MSHSIRLLFTALIPVGRKDVGADAELFLTVDIDADESKPLRDSVVFVDPTEDELRDFHGVRESGLDRAREQAECARYEMERQAAIAAEAVERARTESRRIVDEWLMVTRECAQFEREARGVGLNGRAEDDVALAVTEVAS
jgi:hypothetical protein